MGGRRLELGTWGAITTFERGGAWYARASYRNDAGVTRPVERRGDTPKKAAAKLRRDLRAMAEESRQNSEIGGSTRLTTVIEMHFAWLAEEVAADRRSPGTVRAYRSHYRHHLHPRIEGWRLDEVTTQRLDRVLADIGAQASLQVAKSARAILSAALKLAVRYGAIPTNPMLNARGTPAPPKKDVVTLTAAQSIELMQALRDDPVSRRQDLPDLVLWMLTMSDRIGNALATRWSRIDLDENFAVLGGVIIWVNGAGLVERKENVSSKTRGRIAKLPDVTRRRLRERAIGRDPRCDWVFPHRGTRNKVRTVDTVAGPRDPSNVSRQLREAMTRVGYGWVTSHVFRKTVATGLRDAGVPTHLVANYLGHTDDRETTSTYIGDGSTHPAIVAALNDRWAGLDADVIDMDSRRRAQ